MGYNKDILFLLSGLEHMEKSCIFQTICYILNYLPAICNVYLFSRFQAFLGIRYS